MMTCRLAFYNPEWDSALRAFALGEAQLQFVALPSAVLDLSIADIHRYPVVILHGDEPVGFFVLHRGEEIQAFTPNPKAILLRAFSIDGRHQGQGYAGTAMKGLAEFVGEHFPEADEIVLYVNESNGSARRLYEKSGFQYTGAVRTGRSGPELMMSMRLGA